MYKSNELVMQCIVSMLRLLLLKAIWPVILGFCATEKYRVLHVYIYIPTALHIYIQQLHRFCVCISHEPISLYIS